MEREIKGAQYQNSEIVQGSISNNIVSYIDATLNTSKDPFASKTNKYAETEAVEITAKDKGIWIRWSKAGTAAVANTDNNYYLEAGNSKIFFVQEGNRYLRIIEDAASATSIVVELQ